MSLNSSDPVLFFEGLHQALEHPLYRREVAKLLAEAMRVQDKPLLLATCKALEHLNSNVAVPALVNVLAGSDEQISQGAWKALKAITGQRLPLDSLAWNDYLGGSY